MADGLTCQPTRKGAARRPFIIYEREKDILGQVLLTQEAWTAWQQKVASAGPELLANHPGLRLEDIPDEAAELVGDQLRIHVTLPDGTVLAEMMVPAAHWAWMQG